MAYDEALGDRIRAALVHRTDQVEEKNMFGGVCFMVAGKMCVGVFKDEMMCRIGEEQYQEVFEKTGCREMIFTDKPMKGYVLVSDEGMKTREDFDYWIGLCLAFNPKAKAAKRKNK